jgi:hypothetical protein
LNSQSSEPEAVLMTIATRRPAGLIGTKITEKIFPQKYLVEMGISRRKVLKYFFH